MPCSHDRYRKYPYMQSGAAMKAMKKGDICYLGPFITQCEDCGVDISVYKIRIVSDAADYLGGLK